MVAVLLAAALLPSSFAQEAISPPLDLLRSADAAAFAPEAFRARLRITPPEENHDVELEVWRRGERRTLVRFLEPKERGKFLLYLDEDVWFLSPGARRPVKLPRSFRLRGSATLDDLLGVRYSREYVVDRATRHHEGTRELVVFELLANAKGAAYARVRYSVDPTSGLPVRAESFLASGRSATIADFLEWREPGARVFKRLLLRDMLRGGAKTGVELLELEARRVPLGLFELDDGSVRANLSAAGSLPE